MASEGCSNLRETVSTLRQMAIDARNELQSFSTNLSLKDKKNVHRQKCLMLLVKMNIDAQGVLFAPRQNCDDGTIDMMKVIRYKCKWCGREFRTPNLHKCRFNPSNRCCLSCKHCGRFSSFEEEDWNVRAECVSDGVFAQPTITVKGFHCMKSDTEVGEGGYNDLPTALYGAISDGHGCQDWEIMDGYCGSQTFAAHQRKLEGEADGKNS